jgi:hypothetical protein
MTATHQMPIPVVEIGTEGVRQRRAPALKSSGTDFGPNVSESVVPMLPLSGRGRAVERGHALSLCGLFFFVVDYRLHLGIYCGNIGTVVGLPVTVWTQTDHVSWVIRSSIAQSSDMMHFEKRDAFRGDEWSFSLAVLTFSVSSIEDILSDNITPRIHGETLFAVALWNSCDCCEGSISECSSIIWCWIKRIYSIVLLHRGKRQQLENECVSRTAIPVGQLSVMFSVNYKFAVKTITFWNFRKKKEVFASGGVFPEGAIIRFHFLVTDLPLAAIFEHTIRSPAILITGFVTFAVSCYDYDRVIFRSNYSAPLLPPQTAMDVLLAIVNVTNFISPSHNQKTHFSKNKPCQQDAGWRLQ